jgi:predicted transposase YbfD/YdcC
MPSLFALGITSAAALPSAGRVVPTHWAIENNLHWILDVAFEKIAI